MSGRSDMFVYFLFTELFLDIIQRRLNVNYGDEWFNFLSIIVGLFFCKNQSQVMYGKMALLFVVFLYVLFTSVLFCSTSATSIYI